MHLACLVVVGSELSVRRVINSSASFYCNLTLINLFENNR